MILKPVRILLIEDNEGDALLINEMLAEDPKLKFKVKMRNPSRKELPGHLKKILIWSFWTSTSPTPGDLPLLQRPLRN